MASPDNTGFRCLNKQCWFSAWCLVPSLIADAIWLLTGELTSASESMAARRTRGVKLPRDEVVDYEGEEEAAAGSGKVRKLHKKACATTTPPTASPKKRKVRWTFSYEPRPADPTQYDSVGPGGGGFFLPARAERSPEKILGNIAAGFAACDIQEQETPEEEVSSSGPCYDLDDDDII
jgi:hypothetical protein